MKNKKSILLFLAEYRKVKAINLFIRSSLILIISAIILFTIIAGIEKFIFFESYTRLRIDILLIFLIICLVLLFSIKLFYQLSGNLKNYKDEDIAREIGQKNNIISDKFVNAYQLNNTKTKSDLTEELKQKAIFTVNNQLSNIKKPKINEAFISRVFVVSMVVVLGFTGLLFNSEFNNASRRLLNPATIYDIPTPFKINNITELNEILEGDSLNMIFEINDGSPPDSLRIIINGTSQNYSIKIPFLNGNFKYTMKNILHEFSYWAEYESESILDPWDKIKSAKSDVSIIKRPRINSIDYVIIPPEYSKLDQTTFSASSTDIPMLQGSILQINANVNKTINNSWILIDENEIPLTTEGKDITGEVRIDNSCTIVLMCQDDYQINNINPPLNRINIIPDYKPQIFVSSPDNEFSINDNRIIEIDMQIIDDFGFSESWLEYKIIKPDYLTQDSSVYSYTINNISLELKAQRVVNQWDVSHHYLAPDDKIEFYILVADNNDVTGPSVERVGPFIGKIPSLEDLFESITNLENDIMEDTEEIALTIDEVYDLVDELEKELLKSEDVSWEQEQKINESSQKIDEILNDIESINEMLEDIQKEAEENDLFNQDLTDKFNEFQELLDSILTPEMLESINKIKELMSKMTTEQMLSEMKNLKQDISMLEQQLDRFIELFQLVMAEQAFDEFIKMIEEMINQQISISDDLLTSDFNFKDLSSLEGKQINNYKDLKKAISSNIGNIEKFSAAAGMKLENLLDSKLANKTEDDISKTKEFLDKKNQEDSFSSSKQVVDDLNKLLSELNKIKNLFNSEMVNEMTIEFINLIRNIESISFEQEIISNELMSIKSYNPTMKKIAFNQSLIQNKIVKFIEQLISLSNKTLHIPPGVNNTIGSAQLSVQKSIASIEQKKLSTAKSEQKKILKAINETAYILLSSLDKMQSSMSASGLDSYLQQLQEIAESQKNINQGSQQCMNPGGMPGGINPGEELMKRLQAEQEALQKQLNEMLSEMPGEQGSSGLSKALEDMEEVINDFKQRKVTRETLDRQEKILSRMLDSQKSLKQRDYNEKRKSKTSKAIVYDGPMELPSDKGERQTLLTNALQDALDQGYSIEYQIILKKYFKYLEDSETNEE